MKDRDTTIKYTIEGLTAESSEVSAHYRNGNLHDAIWNLYGETGKTHIVYNFSRKDTITADESQYEYKVPLMQVKSNQDIHLKRHFKYLMDLNGRLLGKEPYPDFQNVFPDFKKAVPFTL